MNEWLNSSGMKRALVAGLMGGIAGGTILVGGLMVLGTAFHADSTYFLKATQGR